MLTAIELIRQKINEQARRVLLLAEELEELETKIMALKKDLIEEHKNLNKALEQ